MARSKEFSSSTRAALPQGFGLVNAGDAETLRTLKAVGVRELPEDFGVRGTGLL